MADQTSGERALRLLDLFCGAGGAAMGYHQAGFEVVGVDSAAQPDYPFEFHQGDALHYAAEHWGEFDAVHASPPCQAYVASRFFNAALGRVNDHPRLIGPTRGLLALTGRPYVIENVPQAPLENPLTICGSMFGLRVRRHRRFESNVLLYTDHPCQHKGHAFVGVYGGSPGGRGWNDDGAVDGYTRSPRAASLADAQDAMGIDWADWHGVKEAVPPAYTEHVGHQIAVYIRTEIAA